MIQSYFHSAHSLILELVPTFRKLGASVRRCCLALPERVDLEVICEALSTMPLAYLRLEQTQSHADPKELLLLTNEPLCTSLTELYLNMAVESSLLLTLVTKMSRLEKITYRLVGNQEHEESGDFRDHCHRVQWISLGSSPSTRTGEEDLLSRE